MCILAKLTADQFCTAEHIAPLVVTAELHIAIVLLVQMIEIIGLHDHVIKFQEAESLLHTLLVAFCAEHIVYREACSNIPKKLHIVQIQKPVGIIDHSGLSLTEFNESLHLFLEAGAIVINGLLCHHGTHICTTGRISDHSSAATNQCNGLVPCHLQPLHKA